MRITTILVLVPLVPFLVPWLLFAQAPLVTYEIYPSGNVAGWNVGPLIPATGNTTVSLAPALVTPNTTDTSDLIAPAYRLVAGHIILRAAADLNAERVQIRRNRAIEQIYLFQQRFESIQNLRVTYRNSAKILADQQAAQANLQSVAQSIGLTTATTQ